MAVVYWITELSFDDELGHTQTELQKEKKVNFEQKFAIFRPLTHLV
jgi:hypothetical protein